MKPVYPIYLTFFLLFYCYLQVDGLANTITSQRIDNECLFNKETARMIGEIYVLSNPLNDPNELVQYIQDHLEYFLDDGIAVKSARALGNWMLEQNKTSLDKETIHEVKNKLIDCQIKEEYACKLLTQFCKSDINFTELGNELIWLSKVLPCLARGDLKTYLCTGTEFRKNLRIIISWYGTSHISDPEIAEMIMKDRNCYRRVMADQISLLAIISDL